MIQTGDGSRTLFDTEKNIHFRSLQGARTEADSVFVAASRISAPDDHKTPWRVLELGFGTALNFLATAETLLRAFPEHRLEYTVVEAEPLSPEVFRSLKHELGLKHPWLNELVAEALTRICDPQTTQQTSQQVTVSQANIRLNLYHGLWQQTVLPPDLKVDAIYHDPFGPKDNPDGWTAECFAWSSRHLVPAGRLVTYGAATAVRRAMVASGLIVASLPGTGSKREMTVASPTEAALSDARILPQAKYR